MLLLNQSSHLAGAFHAGICKETFADPVASKVQVSDAGNRWSWATGIASSFRCWEHADSFDAWQKAAFHQHLAPARLRRIEQISIEKALQRCSQGLLPLLCR